MRPEASKYSRSDVTEEVLRWLSRRWNIAVNHYIISSREDKEIEWLFRLCNFDKNGGDHICGGLNSVEDEE